MDFVVSGEVVNCIDMFIVYSRTVFGFAHTVVSLSGFFSAKMVAFITENNQSFAEWQSIF
jgi:hypothetical protein